MDEPHKIKYNLLSFHVWSIKCCNLDEIEGYASAASKGGRGGMITKLQAAKVVTHSGGHVLIANGKSPQVIRRLFEGEKM